MCAARSMTLKRRLGQRRSKPSARTPFTLEVDRHLNGRELLCREFPPHQLSALARRERTTPSETDSPRPASRAQARREEPQSEVASALPPRPPAARKRAG